MYPGSRWTTCLWTRAGICISRIRALKCRGIRLSDEVTVLVIVYDEVIILTGTSTVQSICVISEKCTYWTSGVPTRKGDVYVTVFRYRMGWAGYCIYFSLPLSLSLLSICVPFSVCVWGVGGETDREGQSERERRVNIGK